MITIVSFLVPEIDKTKNDVKTNTFQTLIVLFKMFVLFNLVTSYWRSILALNTFKYYQHVAVTKIFRLNLAGHSLRRHTLLQVVYTYMEIISDHLAWGFKIRDKGKGGGGHFKQSG